MRNPESKIGEISKSLSIDFQHLRESVLPQATEFDAGHGVGGNRLRNQGAIRLDPDVAWKSEDSRRIAVAGFFAAALGRRYGYEFTLRHN
jgi:hypothetical protein